jgi:hypothetical protein
VAAVPSGLSLTPLRIIKKKKLGQQRKRDGIKYSLYLSWFIRSSAFLTKFAVVKTDLILSVRPWHETHKMSSQWGDYTRIYSSTLLVFGTAD